VPPSPPPSPPPPQPPPPIAPWEDLPHHGLLTFGVVTLLLGCVACVMRRQLLREAKRAPARAAYARARIEQAHARLVEAYHQWQRLRRQVLAPPPRPPPPPPPPVYQEEGVDFYFDYVAGQPVVAVATPEPPPPDEVLLSGCLWGLGLGLDHANRVTVVKPGSPAAASGLIKVGDARRDSGSA